MSTCKHGNIAPDRILRRIHESQAGIRHGIYVWRHKCCVCAFARGLELAHKLQTLTGNCECKETGHRAQEELLNELPFSQAGSGGLGRHQCAICALHAGFSYGKQPTKQIRTVRPDATLTKSEYLKKTARAAKYGRAGGESEDHRRLKDYVSKNPQLLGLSETKHVETEYAFISSDQIDVLFKCASSWVGAEVKSARSDDPDIMRGIFQCLKYEALIEATQNYEGFDGDTRIVLVLEKALPSALRPVIDRFKIELRENIKVPRDFR